MVYDRFEIEDNFFEIQSTLPDPKVVIQFNGTGIHTIAGPTPLIEFTSEYNRSAVGQLESIERKITLNGQIVRSTNRNFTNFLTPEGSGTSGLVSAHETLKNLFGSCSAGTLSIFCDGVQFFEKHNVKVDQITFDSDDNFVQVANYTVALSFAETGVYGFAVKNTVDEWSIEPLEDYIYVNYNLTLDKKDEPHNPHILANGSVNRGNPYKDKKLAIIDVPRYNITRKLSAVGLPPTGTEGCTSAGVNSAYIEAQKWVNSRLLTAFDNTANKQSILNSGISAFSNSPGYDQFGLFAKTYLYNHVRTINYSINEGAYSISESWMAMPTGIEYLEDYTIDVGTDVNFVKTVSVKGEVQGLYAKTFDSMTGLLQPTGNLISLDYDKLDRVNLNNQVEISNNKYENAISGFMFHIKPQLYSRASIGLNNQFYDEEWLDNTTVYKSGLSPNATKEQIASWAWQPNSVNYTAAPQIRNPIYVKERQLNIIPVSTSESHNIKKGTLSYSYDFNNKPNIATGVLSSSLTVDTTLPNDVYAESFVLGRALGPVLQDLGTVSSAKKNISIEVSVIPPSNVNGYLMTSDQCPLYTGGYIFQQIIGLVESLKPYGDRPSYLGFVPERRGDTGKVFVDSQQESWNPLEGKYSLQVGFTYQPCDGTRGFRNI